jgi:hypothetical protein
MKSSIWILIPWINLCYNVWPSTRYAVFSDLKFFSLEVVLYFLRILFVDLWTSQAVQIWLNINVQTSQFKYGGSIQSHNHIFLSIMKAFMNMQKNMPFICILLLRKH